MSLGTIKCSACETRAPVKEGKNGSLSATCPGCGAQLLLKTIKSANAMRVRLAPALSDPKPAPAAAAKPGVKDWTQI